ncbi:MAG: hypothetical protein ACIALR_01475, partial [Blastopirellula sp. JB062]
MLKQISYLSFVAICFASLIGCSSSNLDMGEVTGVVTYKGETLPTGTITFVPVQEGLPTAYAEIQEDGTYTASTPNAGSGVPIGKHRVMITAVKFNGYDAPVDFLLPEKYGSDRQSGLTAEVAA